MGRAFDSRPAHSLNTMTRFELVDHTAGIGLRGYGRSLEELFLHMALGMFGIIADVTTVQPMASVPILAQADDLDSLLVAWLTELLHAGQRDQLVFMNAQVFQVIPAPPGISGQATGEAFDPARHPLHRAMKAVTAHEAAVRREGGLWVASVIFDGT